MLRRVAVPRRRLGPTGPEVSVLGVGAGRLGDATIAEEDAARFIDAALELGINLFDTAPSYGLSEERVGRVLAGRRTRVVLSTKVGYGIPGVPDWTGEAVRLGIERARRILRTEHLDVVSLHSCPAAILERDDILRALGDARASGAIGQAGYSGENEDLDRALHTGAFQVVQISVSPWDQGSLELRADRLIAERIGVLAKRPLAGGAFAQRPPREEDEREYQRRFAALALDTGGLPHDEVAIRFAAFAPSVVSALAGTTSTARLRALVAAVERGPLPQALGDALRSAWRARGQGMRGVV